MKALKLFRPAPRSRVIQSNPDQSRVIQSKKALLPAIGPKKSELSEPIRTKKYFCGAYWHSSPFADDNGIGQSENTYRQIVPNSTKLDISRSAFRNLQSALRN